MAPKGKGPISVLLVEQDAGEKGFLQCDGHW